MDSKGTLPGRTKPAYVGPIVQVPSYQRDVQVVVRPHAIHVEESSTTAANVAIVPVMQSRVSQ